MSDGRDEFALIAQHFAPLARTRAARGLRDDAALFDAGGPFVVTTDAIVEGVHFLPDDPVDTVAQKALRVNVSDIAAKGAVASHYLMTLQWPSHRPATEIQAFASGLARDQATFGCTLLGGDTTTTPGPLAISITMFGRPLGATPSRAGAKPGDDVWISGVIGDGVLGLMARRGEAATLDAADVAALVERYRRPQPRVGLAATVAIFARASMDVSDGLLGDAAKIARASGVKLSIDPYAVPLSAMADRWLALQADAEAARGGLLNGGDDYEILFTAPPVSRSRICAAADDVGVSLTRIGVVEEGTGVEAGGLPIGGHVHRLGA